MLLIHCKPENVERLARALKMPLPLPGPQYERRLRRALVAALETDRRRAAAEEQRMKDKAEALKVAAEIAAALGETSERPIAQIRRIVGLMGAEWTWDALRTMGDGAPDDALTREDGQARTVGGVFFAWARNRARSEMARGHHDIPRREFFRCFFDFPPKPRPAPAPKKAAPVKAPKAHDRRARDPRPVEVYVARRRA